MSNPGSHSINDKYYSIILNIRLLTSGVCLWRETAKIADFIAADTWFYHDEEINQLIMESPHKATV